MSKQKNNYDERARFLAEVGSKALHLCEDNGLTLLEASVALEFTAVVARWVSENGKESLVKDFSKYYREVMERRMANGE